MERETPPSKKAQLEAVLEDKDKYQSSLDPYEEKTDEPNVYVAVSPKTQPIIPPEMWAKVFEYLTPEERKNPMLACPEWDRLLSFQKPALLFPKVLECMRGYLAKEELATCRLVNKACKAGVGMAFPEISHQIAAGEQLERDMEILRRHIQEIQQIWGALIVEGFMEPGDVNVQD